VNTRLALRTHRNVRSDGGPETSRPDFPADHIVEVEIVPSAERGSHATYLF